MSLPVFLAEDDPALRDQLIDVIALACNAHVVATETTEAATAHWLLSHPDDWEMAVLDIYLKEGTGFGVLKRLANAGTGKNLVVLTNSADASNRNHCLALGAHAVFDKTRELDAFILHCCERGALHRSAGV